LKVCLLCISLGYDANENDIEEERRAAASKLKKAQSKNKDKPVRLQDYQRAALLRGDHVNGDHDSPKQLTHAQESEALRAEVTTAFHLAAEGTGDDQGEQGEDDFLVPRGKSNQELEDEDDEYRRFLVESVGEKEIEEALRIARVVGEGGSTGEKKAKKSKKSKEEEDERFLRE
jgi:protein KRI1